MKTYKDCPKEYIGSSDIASLTLRGPRNVGMLDFLADGSYMAYVIGNDVARGAAYELVFETNTWMNVYDDDGLVREFKAKEIKVYRCGTFGCIIQLKD